MHRLLRVAVIPLAFAAQAANAQDDINPGGEEGGGAAGAPLSLYLTVADGVMERTISGSGGTPLADLIDEDVAVLDEIGVSTSAEAFLTLANWNALFGDADADDEFFQDPLAGLVDALVFCGGKGPRDLFISPSQSIGTTHVLHAGDIGRPRHDGLVDYLMRADQIKSAFDIAPMNTINVDAFALDPHGSIYLSFEDPENTVGGSAYADGDILWIPGPEVTWGACTVDDVVADSGQVLFTEAEVDAMVVNSNVADNLGVAVAQVGDVDGLEYDPAGTKAKEQEDASGAFAYDLLFSGLNLTVGAVLTTAGGAGAIAIVNGHPLASAMPAPTTGELVGLQPLAWSLEGLALRGAPPYRFLLDSEVVPDPFGPDTELAWGGVAGLSKWIAGWVVYGDAELVDGDVLPSTAVPPTLMHRFYDATNFSPLMSTATDFGSVMIPDAPAAAAGCVLVVQGLGVDAASGAKVLSAPTVVQF